MKDSTKLTLIAGAATLSVVGASFSNSGLFSIMLPMRDDLGISLSMMLMIVLSFHAIEASMFIFSGRLGERVSFFKVYLAGVILSIIGLALIATAGSGVQVLLGRIIGGIGNGLAITNAIALMKTTLPEERQNKSMSVWLGCATMAFALGPFLGGLTQLSSWRLLYALTVLINLAALVCVLTGRKVVPDLRNPKLIFDGIGNLFFAGSIFSAIVFLSLLPGGKATSPLMLTLIIGSAVCFACFLRIERKATNPIFSGELLQNRNFVAAFFIGLTAGACLFGVMYFYNFYAQIPSGLNYEPWLSGLSLMPVNFLVFLISLFVPWIMGSGKYRGLIGIGVLLMAIGFASFLLLEPHSLVYGHFAWRLVLIGVGAGLTFPIVMPIGMAGVRMELAGTGAGWLNFAIMFGASISIPIAQIFYLRTRSNKLSMVSGWENLGTGPQDAVLQSLTSISADPGKLADKVSLPDLSEILQATGLSGMAVAMLVLGFFALFGIIGVGLIPKKRS